jgi:ABC-type methionine transport system permease subunit
MINKIINIPFIVLVVLIMNLTPIMMVSGGVILPKASIMYVIEEDVPDEL